MSFQNWVAGAASALFISVAGTAIATPLATFDITEGTYSYTEDVTGSDFSITGTFAGDVSGAGDTSLTRELVFSADIIVDGFGPFGGDLGPISGSLDDVVAFTTFVLAELDFLAGGALSAASAYMLSNVGTDGTSTFDFGLGELLFSYTGGISGADTLDGTFAASILTASGDPTVNTLVNDGLLDIGLPPIFPDSGASGTYSASFAISAVPLPAGGFLLLGGIAALGVARRRKKAA